ncbi:hypothetical protein DV515_00008957, partial [Chloebia gouldiae]
APRSGSGRTCRLPRPPVPAEHPEQAGAASPGLCTRSPPRAAAAAAGAGGGAGGGRPGPSPRSRAAEPPASPGSRAWPGQRRIPLPFRSPPRSGLRSRTGHGAGAEPGPLPGASAARTVLSWGQRYQRPRGQGVWCLGCSQGELPSGTGCALSPCPVGAAGDCKWESREVRAKEFANTFFSATSIPLHVNRNRG